MWWCSVLRYCLCHRHPLCASWSSDFSASDPACCLCAWENNWGCPKYFGPFLHMWKISMKLLAPGFGLAQSWLLGSWGSKPKGERVLISLYPLPSFSFPVCPSHFNFSLMLLLPLCLILLFCLSSKWINLSPSKRRILIKVSDKEPLWIALPLVDPG